MAQTIRLIPVLLLAFVEPKPLVPPTITGLELKVDPILETKVRDLHLERAIGRTYTKERIQAEITRIQELGPVKNVKLGTRPYAGGVKLLMKVEAQPKVSSLILEGNRLVPASEILGRFKTKVGQILDLTVLYADLNEVARLYLEKGYMYTDITSPDDVTVRGDQVRVRIREFTMGTLRVQGVSGDEATLVRSQFSVLPGQPVKKTDLMASLQNIVMLPFVKDLKWEPEFDPEKQKVHMILGVLRKGTARSVWTQAPRERSPRTSRMSGSRRASAPVGFPPSGSQD